MLGLRYEKEGDFKQAMKYFLMDKTDLSVVNIARMYQFGRGVEIDLEKAKEYYLKSCDCDRLEDLASIYYQEGDLTRFFECHEQQLAESSYDSVKMEDFGLVEEELNMNRIDSISKSSFVSPNVIIRLNNKDLYLNEKVLIGSNYFKTMLNEDWKESHPINENGMIVIDMKQVQKEIVQDQVVESIIFIHYFNYLQCGLLRKLEKEELITCIHLGKYLGDNQFSITCFKQLSIIDRFTNLTALSPNLIQMCDQSIYYKVLACKIM